MKPGEILVRLISIINTDELEEMVFSLHLDSMIWNMISEENFISDYSTKVGNESADWNPGMIGLYSISQDSLHEEVCALPLQPISAELRQQASAFYQKALKSDFVPSTTIRGNLSCLSLARAQKAYRQLDWFVFGNRQIFF